MGIPGAVAPARVTDLDEPDPLFRQTPGQEQLFAKFLRRVFANPVEFLDVIGFAREIDGFRRRQLHARGEFVSARPRLDVGVHRVMPAKLLVHGLQTLHLPLALCA